VLESVKTREAEPAPYDRKVSESSEIAGERFDLRFSPRLRWLLTAFGMGPASGVLLSPDSLRVTAGAVSRRDSPHCDHDRAPASSPLVGNGRSPYGLAWPVDRQRWAGPPSPPTTVGPCHRVDRGPSAAPALPRHRCHRRRAAHGSVGQRRLESNAATRDRRARTTHHTFRDDECVRSEPSAQADIGLPAAVGKSASRALITDSAARALGAWPVTVARKSSRSSA
jgi:hypothetical protein